MFCVVSESFCVDFAFFALLERGFDSSDEKTKIKTEENVKG